MKKRGMSSVITTLLVIVLVLVAVGVVWGVIKNILQGGADGISLGVLTLDAEITSATVDNSSNNVSLIVKRNPGQGELTGIKFIFYDGVNSEIMTEEISLQQLEEKRFYFHLLNLNVNNLIKISIVPIFKSDSGKQIIGNVVNTYEVGGTECIANCTNKVCGTDGCGGSCGSCQVDEYCDTGSCIQGTNPCDLTLASWSETSVVEGTTVDLTVTGTDCTGIDLNYSIYENDIWPVPDTIIESFIATSLNSTWVAEWMDDGLLAGDPEYYFIATVVDNPPENVQSLDLTVTQITCNNNNVIEGAEVCDGTDVTPETCETQGFGGGTLTCLSDCSDYDTSACTSITECNDGIDNDGDTCIDLNDADCTSASDTTESGTDCQACTPVTDPCGTAVCGTAQNGTCGDVSCGTCTGGDTCVGGVCVVQTGAIIADHNVVDLYDTIPVEYLNEVKKMLLGIYGESHGDAYRIGQDELELLNSLYTVQTSTSILPVGDNTSLRVSELNGGEEDFYTTQGVIGNAITFLQTQRDSGNPISAFGFGWCWDMTWHNSPGGTIDPVFNVRWAGSSVGGSDGDVRWGLDGGDTALTGNSVNMDTYLSAVEQYNTAVPETVTFFTTGPVDGNCNTENGYQRYVKHGYMRDYVTANNKVLFDYADILTHDADGSQTTGIWNGNSMACITPTNLGSADVGHIDTVGAVRLAKAMWWMLARISGWDGSSNPPPTCLEGQITSACSCGGVIYSSGYCCSGSYQTTVCGAGSFTETFDDSSNIAINNGVTINNLAYFSTGVDFQSDTSLVSVYEFSDALNLGTDTKGNNNMDSEYGIPVQNTNVPSGFSGNSVELAGAESLSILSGSTLDQTQNHTLCWFAYPTPSISGNQFSKASNYDTWPVSTTGYRWATNTAGGWDYLDILGIYTVDQWVYICNVYDASGLAKSVYVDGAFADSSVLVEGISASSGPWSIGSYCFSALSCGAFWQGLIYQPMWFDRVLSGTEINQLYTNTYFGVGGSGSGDITSVILSTNDVTEITSISWTESGTTGSSSLDVQVTFDGGTNWYSVVNGGSLTDTISSANMQLQYRVIFNFVDNPVSIDDISINWLD